MIGRIYANVLHQIMFYWFLESVNEERKEDSKLKIGIISDIHGNFDALEAVLENFKQNDIEKIICLGDLIGRSHKIRRSSTKNHENAR